MEKWTNKETDKPYVADFLIQPVILDVCTKIPGQVVPEKSLTKISIYSLPASFLTGFSPNQDVMGEKPVKNDAGKLSLDEESKKEAWKEHYERLLNVEFPWNPEDLSEESPVEGPSEPITLEMITKAITKMASGKAAGPSGIVAEMLKPVGEAGAEEVRDLVENIISEGCIPTDWQESFIVNLYKGKGDALNRGNYRGLKLIEQVMKVLERVVEGLIRQRVEIDEMQCGFMSGRGTTDAIFIVRQLQEKHLAANKPLYMAFVQC